MSWIFVGVTLAVGASVGSAVMQSKAGDIAQIQAKTAAKAEEGAALSREADRKARLNEALAAQNAAAGAGGVFGFEGSPLSVMKEDISREQEATERDETMTKIRALTLRAGGRIARRQARTGAIIGLTGDLASTGLKGATASAQAGGGSGGGSGG